MRFLPLRLIVHWQGLCSFLLLSTTLVSTTSLVLSSSPLLLYSGCLLYYCTTALFPPRLGVRSHSVTTRIIAARAIWCSVFVIGKLILIYIRSDDIVAGYRYVPVYTMRWSNTATSGAYRDAAKYSRRFERRACWSGTGTCNAGNRRNRFWRPWHGPISLSRPPRQHRRTPQSMRHCFHRIRSDTNGSNECAEEIGLPGSDATVHGTTDVNCVPPPTLPS